jgi:hypothetical protein
VSRSETPEYLSPDLDTGPEVCAWVDISQKKIKGEKKQWRRSEKVVVPSALPAHAGIQDIAILYSSLMKRV